MIVNLVADTPIEFFGEVLLIGVIMARSCRQRDGSAQDRGRSSI